MIAVGIVSLLVVALPVNVAASEVPWYNQCGGKGYEGPTTCFSGSECKVINKFYSQCEPLPPGERPGPYEQCGGRGYDGFLCDGAQCCSPGLECVFINEYFSQCIPEFNLADVGEPCGPATPDNKRCLLRSRASGPVIIKCSSDTDPNAECVLCGFQGLACCPAGIVRQDRPPCQAAPRATAEIPCNTEKDICEGDVIIPN